MSGPVTPSDTIGVESTTAESSVAPAVLEITESRVSQVGEFEVRRALPRRTRRMVGAWCFVDHMGPATVDERGLGVAPHPHIGLQTVTWLLAGEALHRDSLGTEQVIAPGQLNLMTAGHGVSHSEEGTGRYRGELHGVQLWVAQPTHTRHGAPRFEHHAELPQLEFAAGACLVDGAVVTPGHLAYLGVGRDEVALIAEEPTRALLVGGVPFDEPVLMWWNFVARTRDEITTAHHDWTARATRFGHVDSQLPRYDIGPPPWRLQ